jgi:hypothetical protein
MVVDRVPRGRDVRLADDQRPVVGVHEARLSEQVDQRLGHAGVRHGDLERPSSRYAAPGRDRELAALAAERGPARVDAHRLDVESLQVEVERREVLRRDGLDRRDTLEHVGRRVVGDIEVVMAHVVAAIAIEREVRVAGTRRPRRERFPPVGIDARRCHHHRRDHRQCDRPAPHQCSTGHRRVSVSARAGCWEGVGGT